MTQPLPSPAAKPAPAGSPRLDIGNFFQPSPQSGAAPDFESLFAGQNSKDRHETTGESESARKKKKVPAEETPLAAQPAACQDRPNHAPAASLEPQRQPNPEGDSPHTSPLQNPIEKATTVPSGKTGGDNLKNAEQDATAPQSESTGLEAAPQPVSPPDAEGAPPAEQKAFPETDAAAEAGDMLPEEPDAKISEQPDEPNPVVDGMETAPNDPEMISLSTFDQAESGAPLAAREPLVTSSNRFSISTAIAERTGVAAISGSAGSAESQLGQAGTGSAQVPANLNPAASKHAPQAAASLLKTLGAELEKFRQSGESQVQLDVPVGDGESVKVRLNLRAGELRSTFITDSAELREALQKAWPDFAQTSRDRGFRFGDPSFQNAFSQNPSNPQGRQSQTDRETAAALQPASKTPARRTVIPAAAGAGTALWA